MSPVTDSVTPVPKAPAAEPSKDPHAATYGQAPAASYAGKEGKKK